MFPFYQNYALMQFMKASITHGNNRGMSRGSQHAAFRGNLYDQMGTFWAVQLTHAFLDATIFCLWLLVRKQKNKQTHEVAMKGTLGTTALVH